MNLAGGATGTHLLAALVFLAAAATAAAPSASAATGRATGKREIGWWYGCPQTADDPAVAATIAWAKAHPTIIHTIIMNCGVLTCATNHSAPRGGNYSCLNNGGIGGVITGEVMPSGKKLIPALSALGVKVELWLGEDDSRQSALHMFENPKVFAADLLAVAKANPGLSGFNLDTETAHSTAADAALSVPFLKEVTSILTSAPGGPLRFSTDVACSAGTGWCPMISDCALLANSGIDKIMNMATYNAADFASWYQSALTPALAIPKDRIGAGLGVWNDSTLAHTWNLTPESAEQRICALMNHSFMELDLFILSQGSEDPLKNFPYEFWIPQLEKFVAGGGCPLPAGTTVSCPAPGAGMPTDSWKPGGDPGCCESSESRGKGHECNVTCAQAECAAAGALAKESWFWKAENYSQHPCACAPPAGPPARSPACLLGESDCEMTFLLACCLRCR